jgi:hypothetical protein
MSSPGANTAVRAAGALLVCGLVGTACAKPCASYAETCSSGLACCAGFTCTNGDTPASSGECEPSCPTLGTSCANHCCSGLECRGGTCCAAAGTGCQRDKDCCTGQCNDGVCACNQNGGQCDGPEGECCSGLTCQPPDASTSTPVCCFAQGGTCSSSSDCCDYSTCSDGSCVLPPPPTTCTQSGFCLYNSECCSGRCYLLCIE